MTVGSVGELQLVDRLRVMAADSIEQAEAERRARVSAAVADLSLKWINTLCDKAENEAAQVALSDDKRWWTSYSESVQVDSTPRSNNQDQEKIDIYQQAAESVTMYFQYEGLWAEHFRRDDSTAQHNALKYSVKIGWMPPEPKAGPEPQTAITNVDTAPERPGIIGRVLSRFSNS